MTKKAAVINDLSSFGRCSLTAAIAVLSAMGHRPCPLPTAVLSAQTEFPVYAGEDLTALMPRYTEAWESNHERFDGICTGYFARSEQLRHTLDFLDRFQTDGTLLLVDPVMGDNGRLYPAYDRTACGKMQELARRADVLTPNLSELCLLTGADYDALTAHADDADYLNRVAALAAPLSAGRGVIVTGVRTEGCIVNLTVQDGSADALRSRLFGESLSGTGDIFSAVVFGALLGGDPLTRAAERAARFVELAIADTVKEAHNPLYGVNFEKFLYTLNEVNRNANS